MAWDHIPFTPELERLAPQVSAVCFGSLAQRCEESRATIRRFVRLVPDSALKVFDINLRQNYYDKEVVEESLKLCNVLKINDEELEVVRPMLGLPAGDADACIEAVERYGLRGLILTCGSRGSYVYYPDGAAMRELYSPVPKVDVVDTVGAGDSFTAAFVMGLLNGMSMSRAHSLATRTAAFVCTSHGATPRLPDSLKAEMAGE